MAARTPLAEALAAGPVVLDGGLATELEHRGHDLTTALWSARLLRDDPAEIAAVHAAHAGAGAQVVTTASYQATFKGFAAAGIDERTTEHLLVRSVELARRGAPDAWVAGSVGPFGAALADGSEYTGDYAPEVGVDGLRRFHRRRMQVLAAAGADVLACETVPAAAEAEALVLEAQSLGVPVWLSLTTVVDADGVVRTRRGEAAADVFALAADADEVVAVGVNCTDPSGVPAAVRTAAATGKPVVVYPNSGEAWDAAGRRWTGQPVDAEADVPRWVAAGARLVGGCCRIGPDSIRRIAAVLRSGSDPASSPRGVPRGSTVSPGAVNVAGRARAGDHAV